MNRLLTVGFCLVGFTPLIARGDSSTTQPSVKAEAVEVAAMVTDTADPSTMPSASGDRSEFRRPRMEGGGGNPGRGGYGWRGQAPSDADWDLTSAFMLENSPVRLKIIESLPDGGSNNIPGAGLKARLKARAFQSYRSYKAIESTDPELASIILGRVKLEDEATDIAGQVKPAEGAARDALKQRLRDKVSNLVDLNIKERQMRISRLEATLKTEQDRLASDSKQRDKLVEDRTKTYLREWPGPGRFPPGGEPRGAADGAPVMEEAALIR